MSTRCVFDLSIIVNSGSSMSILNRRYYLWLEIFHFSIRFSRYNSSVPDSLYDLNMKIASRWFKSLLNHFLTHSAACASCYLNWFLFDCFCSHQWAEVFLSYDHYISRSFFFGSGSHLSSHTVASIVLSAVLVLTVVFGMGTGVTPKRIATGSFLLLSFVQLMLSALTLTTRQ